VEADLLSGPAQRSTEEGGPLPTVTESSPAELKRCEFCGRTFEPNRYRPDQKYCSNNCAQRAADAKKAAKRKAAAAAKPRLTRKCDHCGKEFEPYRHNNRFCSDECRNRFHAPKSNAQRRERYANDPDFRKKHIAESSAYYKRYGPAIKTKKKTPAKRAEAAVRMRKWLDLHPEKRKQYNAERKRKRAAELAILAAVKPKEPLPRGPHHKEEKDKAPFKIGSAVEGEIPIFENLFQMKRAFPERIRNNRKLLERELLKTFSQERIDAAILSKQPLVAARRFISISKNLSFDVVAKYHKASRKLAPQPVPIMSA
jgi:hypothetical protein